MKNDIGSLELYYLMKELKVVEGSKIDRIYSPKGNPKELTINCFISGSGKTMLKVLAPRMIFIDDTKEATDTPTGFCMMLRKYLEGGRIRSIEQKDFERVITITIERKFEDKILNYYIIAELFSKGNIIFCDNEFKILNIVEEQAWKDRILKRNETYIYPKSKINTLEITEDEFRKIILNSDKESIVKTLAIVFNLGGFYAEEICFNSKVLYNTVPKNITEAELKNTYKEFKEILNKKIQPNLCEGSVLPFILNSLKHELKEYDKFNNALRENYDTVKHVESKKDTKKNVEKIQETIDSQIKLLNDTEEWYKENQAKGELIYEKYQEISDILKKVKEARTKKSWMEIKQKIDENPELKKVLKDIDEKNNSIIIEINK